MPCRLILLFFLLPLDALIPSSVSSPASHPLPPSPPNGPTDRPSATDRPTATACPQINTEKEEAAAVRGAKSPRMAEHKGPTAAPLFAVPMDESWGGSPPFYSCTHSSVRQVLKWTCFLLAFLHCDCPRPSVKKVVGNFSNYYISKHFLCSCFAIQPVSLCSWMDKSQRRRRRSREPLWPQRAAQQRERRRGIAVKMQEMHPFRTGCQKRGKMG